MKITNAQIDALATQILEETTQKIMAPYLKKRDAELKKANAHNHKIALSAMDHWKDIPLVLRNAICSLRTKHPTIASMEKTLENKNMESFIANNPYPKCPSDAGVRNSLLVASIGAKNVDQLKDILNKQYKEIYGL